MILTWLGPVLLAAGIWILVRGSLVHMWVFGFTCALMAGSGVAALPALGGSTIPPATLATLFMAAKLLLHHKTFEADIRAAFTAEAALIAFVVYGLIAAVLLPYLFADDILVVPMKPKITDGATARYPLTFTAQNITASFNLVTTAIAAVVAYVTGRRLAHPARLAVAVSALLIVHSMLGWYDVVTRGTPLWLPISLFRNGGYLQLEQRIAGIPRMSGILSEASSFATLGFATAVLVVELWIRNVERRWTGPAAAIGILTLLASTSSTAYGAVGMYLVLMAVRGILTGGRIGGDRSHQGFYLLLLGVTAITGLFVLSPEVGDALRRLIVGLTVDKADSHSGVSRAYWAKQGLDAFVASWGLGIGPGSFRSSSLVTAIVGSTGVAGIILFGTTLAATIGRTHGSQHLARWPTLKNSSDAFAWAALIMLVPACFSSSTPDPGVLWGLIAGMALGMRHQHAPAFANPRLSGAAGRLTQAPLHSRG